jgi:hypothetical protein
MTRNYPLVTAVLASIAAGLGTSDLVAQVNIPTAHVLPVSAGDTNKTGFIWRVSQVAATQPNQLAWTEDQLAGLKGDNLADPNAVGAALGPAAPANPATAPITFEIPDVINFSKTAATTKGNFTPDLQMPGIPGTDPSTLDGGTGNAAAEVLTYIQLPAGTTLLGVNSDDGFRMSIGGATPSDKFAVNVGQFEGGRGAANTIFSVNVAQAGLYAARVMWENGGGDANVEVFSMVGTTPVLVNDLANGGLKAFRAVTNAVAPAYAQTVVPAPNATGVSPVSAVKVELVDGTNPVNTNSLSLSVDGAAVPAAITKAGGVTTVSYQVSRTTPFLAGSHTASFSYSDGASRFTNTWSFVVKKYITLDAAWRVNAPDTSKPGFVFNIFANADPANQANSVARAEYDLALPVDAGGGVLGNQANPAAVGAASGAAAAANPANAAIHFEIPSVINLAANSATSTEGNFKPDLQMPGSPSIDATTDGQAAEMITYITLPVGVIEMGVNSDDNFATYAGANVLDAFQRVVLGTYDQSGGRGASDTVFAFNVPVAGTYAFRTVWENGAGGSSIEWFTVNPDGSKVLLNDVANGGIATYRSVVSAPAAVPYVRAVTPTTMLLRRQVLDFSSSLSVLLADGANQINAGSVKLEINSKNIPITTTRSANFLSVTADVSADMHLPGDVAALTFNDTGSYTRTQKWTLYNLVNLVFPATPAVSENFDSYPVATGPANTVPPGWVASNFTYHETPGWDLTDLASDAFLDWVLIDATSAASLENLQNDTAQVINGQPISDWFSGNVLFSASDSRAGGGLPQVRQVVTKAFDLSSVTNPVLSFYSALRISGNRTEGMFLEYSIDGGTNWLPAAYYQRSDTTLVVDIDGSYDAVASFDTPGSILTRWNDPVLGARGGKLGDYLLSPLSPSLSPYLVERRDAATSRRVEAVRLPKAGKQKDVRLRFAHIGSCGWYWVLDNIAIYDIAGPPASQPPALSITKGANSITITYEGALLQSDSPNGAWTPVAGSSPLIINNPTGTKFYRAVNP